MGFDEVESDLVEGARRSVEIIVQDSSRPLVVRRNAFNHLLMPFAVWAADPCALFERWLDLHGRLGKAANLLFATLNNWPAYIENRFLNLTAFAEAYHRTLHDSPPVTPDEHQVATEQMLKALSTNKLRNHYGPRLKYADEQGLRSRMKALFRRAERAVEDVEGWRAAGLPDSLVETRNALTHRAGSDEKTLEGSALFWATKRLLVVLQINILLDLQISSEVAAACITQRHHTSRTLFDPI
jgi:HEPN superfamily Apea-like protein